MAVATAKAEQRTCSASRFFLWASACWSAESPLAACCCCCAGGCCCCVSCCDCRRLLSPDFRSLQAQGTITVDHHHACAKSGVYTWHEPMKEIRLAVLYCTHGVRAVLASAWQGKEAQLQGWASRRYLCLSRSLLLLLLLLLSLPDRRLSLSLSLSLWLSRSECLSLSLRSLCSLRLLLLSCLSLPAYLSRSRLRSRSCMHPNGRAHVRRCHHPNTCKVYFLLQLLWQ